MVYKKIVDENSDEWVVIEPKKPIVSFIPLEQENYVLGKSALHTGTHEKHTGVLDNKQAIINYSDEINNEKSVNLSSAVSNLLPRKYAGVHSYLTSYNIKQDFCNFHLINLNNNNFENLSQEFQRGTEINLYPSNDTGKRIVTLQNGLQAVRIPISPLKPNNIGSYGKYYVTVSPKYIETTVNEIIQSNIGEQANDFDSNNINKNCIALFVEKRPFEDDITWNFKLYPNSNVSLSFQTNRLIDSVVEVYRDNILICKKTITGNDFNFNNNNSNIIANNSLLTLGPDLTGWDGFDEMISVNDILRIYPRETYFVPINIEIDFVNKRQDFENLLRFLQNDSVRDLRTNIVEVYDDNGISIDPENGQINGNVVMKYQVGQTDNKEYRKTLRQS